MSPDHICSDTYIGTARTGTHSVQTSLLVFLRLSGPLIIFISAYISYCYRRDKIYPYAQCFVFFCFMYFCCFFGSA